MPNDERNDKGFQKRFGYFVASGTLDLITMWVYIFFLNAFLDIEKKYQPILGWVQYYWSWINSSFSAHIYSRNMVAPGISHLRCVWLFSFKLKFIKFVKWNINSFKCSWIKSILFFTFTISPDLPEKPCSSPKVIQLQYCNSNSRTN